MLYLSNLGHLSPYVDADKSHPPVRDGIDGLRLENVINELCKESDEVC